MMATSRGNGLTRAQNAALSEAARRQMAETVAAFVVVDPAGREVERAPDILDACDRMREMGAGAAIVTPAGRILCYRADAVTAQTALARAERAVKIWQAARLAIQ